MREESAETEPIMTKGVSANKKAEREAAQAAMRLHRKRQLEVSRSATSALEDARRIVQGLRRQRDALASHLSGFYEEIDKLTKGKTLIEVTPLMVEEANEIIKDAKTIITGDKHLDRIKEFVPAGNNPVYPDVLIVMRGVRDSLARGAEELKGRETHISGLIYEGRTVTAALEWYEDVAEEDAEAVPTLDDVEQQLGEKADGSWFFEDEDGEEYFDFEKLDERKLEKYLSTSLRDDTNSAAENDHSDPEGDADEIRTDADA